MKLALIEDGIVKNLIEVAAGAVPEWAADFPTADADAQIGGTYTDGKFGPPPPAPLEERRAKAIERLWTLRRAKISGAATIRGVHLWIDLESRANLTAAVLATQLDPDLPVQWKTTDGGFVTLTATQLATLATDVMAYVQMCFAREAALKAQIEAASDPDAIDITTGWPD